MVTVARPMAGAWRSSALPGGTPSWEENVHAAQRGGFTMVEVIVAIVILAFGLLAMAGTTTVVVRQVNLADVDTERTAALQTTLEHLRSLPYDSVAAGSATEGIFEVRWTVVAPTREWKEVRVVTVGPGMRMGPEGHPMVFNDVRETFTYRIIRP